MNRQNPIGITDSGVGGLTVAREVQRLLPGEDILYFGDSANCPYGNMTRDRLLACAGRMLDFLTGRGVKLDALACNTTSSMIDSLREVISRPLIGIIEPAARLVAEEGLSSVGVIATEFTAASKSYDRLIARFSPDTRVYSEGSETLAALIDAGALDHAAIDAEITRSVNALLQKADVRDIILGCTHYPILLDRFEALFPRLRFIDPSRQEALAVQKRLSEKNALADRKAGSLTIYTSGDPAIYAAMCRTLGVAVREIIHVSV